MVLLGGTEQEILDTMESLVSSVGPRLKVHTIGFGDDACHGLLQVILHFRVIFLLSLLCVGNGS